MLFLLLNNSCKNRIFINEKNIKIKKTRLRYCGKKPHHSTKDLHLM